MALTVGLLLMGLSSSAHAGVVAFNGSGAWRFFGNCQDCAAAAQQQNRPVTGTLTLQNYLQGTALTNANFVSFRYDGSNLLAPYTVPGAAPTLNFVNLGGFLTQGGAQQVFLDFGTQGYFDLAGGNWATCVTNCLLPDDFGNNGSFVLQSQTVPEPGTYALLVVGLGALGFASRRKQRA